MSLTVLYQYHQDEWYHYSITVITCLWLYCISITKMTVRDIGDNCDGVQVSLILVILIQYSQRQVTTVIEYRYHSSWWYWSPMSLTTVSVSPRWVIPVLYQSYHLCLWLYCISITKMSDTCTLSQLSPMSLTVLSVSPRWMIPVLYHSYHLCLWLYCISITNFRKLLSTLPNYAELEQILLFSVNWGKQICDNCDRVQVSLILVILIQ
jgi:hypothetical protein